MSDFDRNYATARCGVGAGLGRCDRCGPARLHDPRLQLHGHGRRSSPAWAAWLTFQAAVVTNAAGNIVGLTPFGQAIYGGPAVIVLMLGNLRAGDVHPIPHPASAASDCPGLVHGLCGSYWGLMLSTVFLTYTGASITRVFFISAASFGGAEPVRLHHAAQPVGHRARSW